MSHPHPDVSVVIPTYNRARLLREAVDSVLGQTRPCREVLVVDDGSTDETPATMSGMENVRYIRQENRGVAAARNRGIEAATGEWVAFLDSDDLWEPHALETLAHALDRFPDAGLIAMRARILRADGTLEPRVRGKKSPGHRFTTAGLIGPDTAGVLTPMVRRDVLRAAGGFDESMRSAEDCDLWVRLSFVTTLVAIPDALLRRRRHDDNLTHDRGLNARMWLRLLDKLERDRPEFVRNHGALVRRARAKEHLRLGRSLTRGTPLRSAERVEGRSQLVAALRAHPLLIRAYRSLLLSYLP